MTGLQTKEGNPLFCNMLYKNIMISFIQGEPIVR